MQDLQKQMAELRQALDQALARIGFGKLQTELDEVNKR